MRGLKPWARQVPKIEARVILVSVPWSERVPPLTLRLTTIWRRLRSAALLSGGTWGSATKTKSSLMWFSIYVVLHASAQLGLDGQRVIQEGTAEGQQASFQGQSGGAALWRCGVGESRGLAVELVDGGGPPGQWRILGVEGLRSWMSRSRWAQQRCLGPS